MSLTVDSDHDDRYIAWFDIDNCLYSASANISHAMGERIHKYFTTLGLDDEEASELHMKYYTQYGLALRGLVKHHDVDPIDFDTKCDGSLPLEEMIKPNPQLRKLFEDIDRSKARLWCLTNAYRPHAERVLRILGVDDLLDGLVYCDYEKPNFSCKPEEQYYHDALAKAKVTDPSKCLFVDDSRRNVDAAKSLGWGSCAHFCESGVEAVEGGRVKILQDEVGPAGQTTGVATIADLEELRILWSHIFKT